MNNAKLPWSGKCTLAAVAILLLSLAPASLTQTAGDQKPAEWKAVEDVFGFRPASLPVARKVAFVNST